MGQGAQHDEVVAGLYEAAVFPDRWHGALTSLMHRVGADIFHFHDWDRNDATTTVNIFSHDWMASGVQQYASYFGAIDPRRALIDDLPARSMIVCHQHFSEASVSRNEFYQDFLIPHGQRYLLGAKVLAGDRRDMIIGLMREAGNTPFDEANLHEAQCLIGHLNRASQLWLDTQALNNRAAFEAQAAQDSTFALLGLDGTGKLAYANGHAEDLLKDGDCLVGRNGGIGATCAGDESRLHRAVREVRETGCGLSLALSGLRSGPQALLLHITPLKNAGKAGPALDLSRACVLVTARSRTQSIGLSPLALFQTFGLTPAESAAALALCEGKTPEEHAQALGVSLATVRTQLRAVFDKTQTRRQSEVVGLLLGMPADGG
jgi:DNA-binding CsgD family transcriptional regulator